MHSSEFCDLVGGATAADLGEYLGVDARTIRRYKSGGAAIPEPVAKLVTLRYKRDASALLGKGWEGYHFGHDGKLYIEGWRGGFDPYGIKGMFYKVQLVSHHEATIRQLEKRIAGLEADVITANEAAVKYRGMVMREARFGLMLERIAG